MDSKNKKSQHIKEDMTKAAMHKHISNESPNPAM